MATSPLYMSSVFSEGGALYFFGVRLSFFSSGHLGGWVADFAAGKELIQCIKGCDLIGFGEGGVVKDHADKVLGMATLLHKGQTNMDQVTGVVAHNVEA